MVSKATETKRAWQKPETRKIEAGSAEASTSGIDDGGPVGSARS